jgi:hypothetical protein
VHDSVVGTSFVRRVCPDGVGGGGEGKRSGCVVLCYTSDVGTEVRFLH